MWDLEQLGLSALERHGTESDNLLIQGENLAVMRALLPAMAGTIKLVYIDPPFNTGGRFVHYHDDLDSPAWLLMMEQRLPLLRELLRPDGVIFVHLDDSELAYCKVLLDRILGRANYVTTIVVQAATPSSFKTVNPGPADVTEYLLMYCRERALYRYQPQYVPCQGVDLRRFSRYVVNPEAPSGEWRFGSVARAAMASLDPTPAAVAGIGSARAEREANAAPAREAEEFALANAEWVFETKTVQRPGARLAAQIAASKNVRGVMHVPRVGRPDLYLYRGRQLYFLARSVRAIAGRRIVVQPLANLWTDIPTSNLFAEGGVAFRYGKKPERLLARLIGLATAPGDLVLDAFAGSGTTGAVAHKLGRRWLTIESGPQARTHALERLKRVVSGTDRTGITRLVEWRGGGGFTFCVPMHPAAEGREEPNERPSGQTNQPVEVPPAGAIVVVAAVMERKGRYLLAQRHDNLLWEFPGGKVQYGEDARAALRREAREELAVEVAVDEPLEVATIFAPRHLAIVFFATRLLAGEPRPLECADLRWVAPAEFASLPMGETDRRMAAHLAGSRPASDQ